MNPHPKISRLGLEIEIITGLQLPHSPDCEDFVLSSVLADSTPTAWALATAIGVKPKAFYVSANQTIWRVIDSLHRRGVSGVDVSVLQEELALLGKMDEIGGFARLAEASGKVSTSMDVRFWAENLVLLWQLRGAVKLSSEIREGALAFAGRDAFVETMTDIGQRLMMLGRRSVTKTLKDEILEVEADVAAQAERRIDKSRWISSGLPIFDERCKPFTGGREDQLVVIAGGSGMGKSVVLRQIGGAALKQGKRVLSISRETSTAGFIEMLAASWSDFDLLNPELEREKLPAFREQTRRMHDEWADKLLFCIEHTIATPLLTIEDVENQVRAFVNLRGQPDAILIDYLQLFGTLKRLGSREETVAAVSHRLQALVREMPGTTMFVAAQLNENGLDEMRQVRREVTEDGSPGKIIHRLPKPGDIRESQAIYHDADRVIFLYKPPIDCRGVEQRMPSALKPEVWWYQEKRRRGGVAITRCWFEKRYTRFVEVLRHEADKADVAEQASTGSIPSGGLGKNEFQNRREKK